MIRLILVTMLMIMACAAMAANVYLPPVRNIFTDGTIIPIYYNTSGARGLTALKLKQDVALFARLSSSKRISDATTIFNLMTTATANKLVKRASATAGTYDRVLEIKDKTGKIVYYVQQNGAITMGTPVPFSISSVYPVNGATNVSNGVWFHATSAGLGWIRQNPTTPAITFSKSRLENVGISNTYIVGSSLVPLSDGGRIYSFPNFSGARGGTYTMRVNRAVLIQTDGESTHSCGSAMTDAGGGICQSTFTMK